MTENFDNIPKPESEETAPIMYLSGLDEINDDDIANLRELILPEQRENFDIHISDDEKRLMALLAKMSEEEVRRLVKLQREAKYLPGIHKVGGRLLRLSQMTGDSRYYDYYKSKEEKYE